MIPHQIAIVIVEEMLEIIDNNEKTSDATVAQNVVGFVT
jgi:hypothetical protein